MRKLLLSIAALVCTFSVSAQRATSSSSSFFSTEKAEQPITFGVRGGVNFAGMSGSDADDLDGRVGFNFGVNVDIPLLQSLYLQTGLYATQKGAKYEENEDDIKYEDEVNPLYLEVPVLASYRYNFSDAVQLQFNVGPYFAYGIAGKYKTSASSDGLKLEEESDYFGDDDDQYGGKRFDVGLQVGTGVTIKKFFVGCAYEFGFSKAVEDSNAKNTNFMVNVGYNF